MKAEDPPRMNKKMIQNNVETKCAVHFNENFPYDKTPVEKGILFEEEINDTPSFTKQQKMEFCNKVYKVQISDLPILAEQLAQLAQRQDT